jgi:uncharacterized protein (TIGR02001 family)
MKLIRGAVLVGLLGAATAAQAGVTSTWTLTNDYDFRGLSQTAGDPALQASVDYAHASGWYIGAWGSNIDFGVDEAATGLKDPNIEVDLYTGFTKTLDSGLSYDLGGILYSYPKETDFNYVEAYAGLGYTDKSGLSVKGKFFYSPDFGGDTTSGNTPAQYLTADLSMPLPSNFSISAHAGYSWGEYWDDLRDAFPDPLGRPYFDYAIGVSYTYSKMSFAAKWIDGSDLKEADGARFLSSEGRLVFSVVTTFPWGE